MRALLYKVEPRTRLLLGDSPKHCTAMWHVFNINHLFSHLVDNLIQNGLQVSRMLKKLEDLVSGQVPGLFPGKRMKRV